MSATSAARTRADHPPEKPRPLPEDLRERRRWKHLFRYSNGRTGRDGYEEDRSKAPVTWESLKRFWTFVRPHRHLVYLLCAVTLISQGATVVMPVAIGKVLDVILPRQDGMLLNLVALGLVLFVLLRAFYLYVARELVNLAGSLVVRDVRLRLHTHLQSLSVQFLEDYQVGRIVSRIMSDTRALQQLLSGGIISTASSCLRLFFVAGTLLWIDWRLTALSCFTLPFFIWGMARYIRRLRPAHKELSEDRARIFAKATETFSGVRVVKAYGTEKKEDLVFTRRIHEMLRKALLMRRTHFSMTVIWQISTWLGLVAMLWYGGHRVMAGAMTTGELVAFYGLLGLLFQPIAELINVSDSIQGAMASIERVTEVLDEKPEIADPPNAIEAGVLRGAVRFENVHFKYRQNRRKKRRREKEDGDGARNERKRRPATVQDISFSVRPGECIALVGPSGAGKTTISNLLARFYDVDRGAVKVDGVDIRDYRLSSYRKNLALVLQENFLFRGSIRENIAYGRPGASDEEVIQAARMAGAWDFICEQEEGLDATCGERGVKLSGGQKQRISIARAILADPRILILDEATSALDSQTEAQIQVALETLMEGRTTFVIAHRLSTIVGADKIIVLDEGRIVEMGTHEELLALEGCYHDLFMEQYGKVEFGGQTVAAIDRWQRKNGPVRAGAERPNPALAKTVVIERTEHIFRALGLKPPRSKRSRRPGTLQEQKEHANPRPDSPGRKAENERKDYPSGRYVAASAE